MSGDGYIGEFNIGDVVRFAFSNRGPDGTTTSGWGTDPATYSVYDQEGTQLESGLNLTEIGSTDCFIPDATDLFTINDSEFDVGDVGFIQVIGGALDGFMWFRVGAESQIVTSTRYLDLDAMADGTAEGVPNTVLGRLRTVELNQIRNLSPKMARILGMLGENSLIDGYTHDDAGNITGCRLRIFQKKADVDAANVWADTQNESDPASSLETGEVNRVDIDVTHLLPRNLRTHYESQVLNDETDRTYDESSVI